MSALPQQPLSNLDSPPWINIDFAMITIDEICKMQIRWSDLFWEPPVPPFFFLTEAQPFNSLRRNGPYIMHKSSTLLSIMKSSDTSDTGLILESQKPRHLGQLLASLLWFITICSPPNLSVSGSSCRGEAEIAAQRFRSLELGLLMPPKTSHCPPMKWTLLFTQASFGKP